MRTRFVPASSVVQPMQPDVRRAVFGWMAASGPAAAHRAPSPRLACRDPPHGSALALGNDRRESGESARKALGAGRDARQTETQAASAAAQSGRRAKAEIEARALIGDPRTGRTAAIVLPLGSNATGESDSRQHAFSMASNSDARERPRDRGQWRERRAVPGDAVARQARTVWGDHQRFKDTYFKQYRGPYFTGDGCRRDE